MEEFKTIHDRRPASHPEAEMEPLWRYFARTPATRNEAIAAVRQAAQVWFRFPAGESPRRSFQWVRCNRDDVAGALAAMLVDEDAQFCDLGTVGCDVFLGL